jgi:hypothetical protein
MAEEAKKTGLKIQQKKDRGNENKQKAIRPISTQRRKHKKTYHFTYLGSVINKDGEADDDIKSRIIKARYAFSTL